MFKIITITNYHQCSHPQHICSCTFHYRFTGALFLPAIATKKCSFYIIASYTKEQPTIRKMWYQPPLKLLLHLKHKLFTAMVDPMLTDISYSSYSSDTCSGQ